MLVLLASSFLVSGQIVSPSPATGNLGVAASQSTTYHFTVPLSKIKALGAATTGSVALFTTAPGIFTIINSVEVQVTQAISGGGITAATAGVVSATPNTYGTATNAFIAGTTPAAVFEEAVGSAIEPGGTAVNLNFTSTTANLGTATAGIVDVWITRTELR
jgi:hypothetical protein